MADDGEGPPQPVWEGEVDENGLPHGKGIMRYPPPPVGEDEEEKPADLFEGYLEHGKRKGFGKYTWSNGSTYEGNYEENKKHGKGKLTIPNIGVFEGDFVEDVMTGQGLFSYTNGDKYMGAFEAAKRHGQGMYFYKDAQCQLMGEWEDDVFKSGRWVLKDGSMFSGEFSDMHQVSGTYFFSGSQLVQSGVFKAGQWVGNELKVGKVEDVMRA